jgi:acetyl esterase/lipase
MAGMVPNPMAKKAWWKKLWRTFSEKTEWLLEYLSPLGFINSLVPKDGFDKHDGIAFGGLARQKLDVYVPRNGGQDLPVVVFFYGGTWQSGRRQDYLFLAEALTARGIVAVIPDYRLYPEVRFPNFIEDGAAAVAWVRHHIGAYGGGASRLFLMGHSAGAYIAAMLALNPNYLAQVGMSPDELKGFIGLAGPYDFLPLKRPRLIKIFGGADDIPETQPVNFARAKAPPALLLHGAADKIVAPRNSERLAQRLREAGSQVEKKFYRGFRHMRIIVLLASPLQGDEPLMENIEHFISANQ